MNFRAGRRQRDEASLDLTPLIDMVFLLLIFFLVTATFAQRDSSLIPVDLPEGTSGTPADAGERVSLIIGADGTMRLRAGASEGSGEALDRDALRGRLRELHDRDPDLPVYLRGDRSVRYGSVMEALDLAREIGFRRVYNVIYRPQP